MDTVVFRLNFLPNHKDCGSISFLDESVYPIAPSFPVLKITLPDINKYVSTVFVPKAVNVITPKSLGIGKLSDGLYTFDISVKPNNVCFAKITDFRICDALCMIGESLCNDSSEKNIKDQMANWRSFHAAKEIAACDPLKANLIYQTTLAKIKKC